MLFWNPTVPVRASGSEPIPTDRAWSSDSEIPLHLQKGPPLRDLFAIYRKFNFLSIPLYSPSKKLKRWEGLKLKPLLGSKACSFKITRHPWELAACRLYQQVRLDLLIQKYSCPCKKESRYEIYHTIQLPIKSILFLPKGLKPPKLMRQDCLTLKTAVNKFSPKKTLAFTRNVMLNPKKLVPLKKYFFVCLQTFLLCLTPKPLDVGLPSSSML